MFKRQSIPITTIDKAAIGQAWFSPTAAKQARKVESKSGLSNNGDLLDFKPGACKNIEEAIDMIPLPQKEAYLEAMEKAPYLFEDETDPRMFLRRCDYDIWAAAERLCLYWKERKELFGPERAFLPLVLTGDGALSKNDVNALKAGLPAVLPETQNGFKVIFADRRQASPHHPMECHLRGLFYLMRYMAKDQRTQTDGILFVSLLISPRMMQPVKLEHNNKMFSWLFHVFPVKVRRFYIMNCLPKHNDGVRKLYMVQDVVSSFMSSLIKISKKVPDNLEVHFGRKEGDLSDILVQEAGFSLVNVPRSMGGCWDFAESNKWCQNRAALERKIYKLILRDVKKERVRAKQNNNNTEQRGEDKAFKKRALNVLHSRRSREKRRKHVDSLNESVNKLLEEKEHLLKEQSRLEGLLNHAHELISSANAAGEL